MRAWPASTLGPPAGCVALLPEDVAELRRYGCQARDQRVLADVARHAGDVVAAVAAPTRGGRAAAAADRGRLRGAARRLRPGAGRRSRRAAAPRRRRRVAQEAVSIGVRPLAGTNVCHRFRLATGDAAAAMRQGRRGGQRGIPDAERGARADGAARRRRRVGGRQADDVDRHADAVQPARRPRGPVRPRARGPSGSSADDGRLVRRQDVRAHEARLAALARKAGRPVKVVLDRTEEFLTLNRHPATIRVRVGATPGRHARRQGARLLGRHRRVRRLRPGRRDEARLRRRRPVPDPARARRRARDLHEPPAQRRLPRLWRDAVDLRVASGRWTSSPAAWA